MKQSTNNLVYILFYNNLMYSLTVRFFTTVNHRKTIVEMRENLNFWKSYKLIVLLYSHFLSLCVDSFL